MLRMRHPAARYLRRLGLIVVALPLVSILHGCGGGGGGQQQSPPPATPDFALAVNPPSISISAGASAPAVVSATGINGFASQISVNVSGLPAGVSAAPASFTLTPGSQQSVTFSASVNAAVASSTAAFAGISGSLNHTANLGVSVTPGSAGPLSTRTKYLRTDAVTEYPFTLNSHWEVFHSPTSRIFVTDPDSNQVFVFDSNTETLIAKLTVPGAFGIDETPNHGTLYVGTLIGDVYTIDPVALQITRRYLGSEIGPYGYQGLVALPLADGRIALLGSAGGFPSIDGSASFAVWNPAYNSIQIYASIYGSIQFAFSHIPVSIVCGPMGNIGGFALTADRTKIIAGSIFSDSTLCEVDATTGQDNYIASAAPFLFKIFRSPDGKYIAVPKAPKQIVLYDAHTLNQLSTFTASGDVGSASQFVFSADSQTLYVPSSSIVYAYNTLTGQLAGWLPNIVVEPTSGGFTVGTSSGPNFQLIDPSGLLFGPLEQGFGFLDTTTLRTGPLGTSFLNAYLTPATGPVTGGTTVQWSVPGTVVMGSSKVYFGKNPASSISIAGGSVNATTAPGGPGPVDVYLSTSDGSMQIVVDGFSYGPSILQVTPDTSIANGGGIGTIYGYGFGPASSTSLPGDLSVAVAGVQTQVIGFNSSVFGPISPPYLLQSVSFTIPPGSVGALADVSVTTGSGTAVAPAALSYISNPQLFPLAGSILVQGIYDPVRDLYYFTDIRSIQVFSLTQGAWLSPINIPAPPGTLQRLWGIALSPDGSKLVVSDAQASVIYLIDPANTSSIKTIPFAPMYPQGVLAHPVGLAISDSGIAYITVFAEGGTGYSGYFKMDTSTGALTDYHIPSPELNDLYLKAVISSDNSRVFFNNDGAVFNLDTATDQITNAVNGPGCCYGDYDLTLSRNQTRFAATAYLFDSDLNGQSYLTLNDREIMNTSYVYGAQLSPDGTLFFQPSINGMDVFDGRLGTLRARISLRFTMSANYQALVANGKDNVLLAITGTNGDGIAVLDMTALSEPAPLPYSTAISPGIASQSHNSALFQRLRGNRNLDRSQAKETAAAAGLRAVPHITRSLVPKDLITTRVKP